MKKAASLIFSEKLPGILKYTVVLLMLSTVMRSPTLFLYNFNPDEATYTVISREMLDGALYYRDAVDTKPPGILHIYSAIFAVAGLYNRIALYCTLFVVVALTGLLLSFIGKRLWNLRTGRVAGLLYVVAGAFGNPSDFQTANCELFMNLPTVAAFFLYLRTRRTGGTWGYFGAGLLLSGAALIKFQAGFAAAAIALHLMMSPGPMLLPLLLGLGGLFLPFGSYAVYYYYMDAWAHMTWAILYNISYVEALNLKLQLFNALKKTAVFIEFAFPLIIPAAFFAMHGLTRISHQVSAATSNMPASTALRSVGLLNIVPTMPTSSSRRVPCIHGPLQRFATIPGEKCGFVHSRGSGGLSTFSNR